MPLVQQIRVARSSGVVCGLLAAALFGMSAPFAKRLGAGLHPLVVAGVLYLGAGVSLALIALARGTPKDAQLRRADLPTLLGIIALGGVLGPALMLIGIAR